MLRTACGVLNAYFWKNRAMPRSSSAFRVAWGSFTLARKIIAAMEKRTNLYGEGDTDGIKALEKELLAQNAEHKDWCCTEEMMAATRGGKALYLHCLPADINDISCKDGEVAASVFDRYRTPLYKQASFKPYIIAAMIFLAKVKNPQATLKALEDRNVLRFFQ